MEYKEIALDQIHPDPVRDVRPVVVQRIAKSIHENGYVVGKPVVVVKKGNDDYLLVDGHHRYEASVMEKLAKIPAQVVESDDPFKLAVTLNNINDTYAPLDVFDWCDIIRKESETLTQEEIAKNVGISRDYVARFVTIVTKYPESIIKIVKSHQLNRGDQEPLFEFTEGWFRNSGTYGLSGKRQEQFFDWFWNLKKEEREYSSMIKKQSAKLQKRDGLESLLLKELYPDVSDEEKLPKIEEVILEIDGGEWDITPEEKFKSHIDQLNKEYEESHKQRMENCNFVDIKIELGSIDMIMTDPPYGEDSLHVWEELSLKAKDVLKPGGWLVSYVGKWFLPDAIEGLKKHLNWFWIDAIEFSDSPVNMRNQNISSMWRPVLIFYKPPMKMPKHMRDLIKGSGKDKEKHEWGQNVTEFMSFIEIFSQPGDTVFDPFVGGGTTIEACISAKRNYVVTEMDETKYKQLVKRFR